MRTVADIDWASWEPTEKATLLFVIRDGKILLIHKKRGLGAGKINGPGGRLEPGETAVEGAIREVEEELCTTPTGVRRIGSLRFQFIDGYAIEAEVFTATDCDRCAQETEEAKPEWFSLEEIPYNRMWADDELWMPLMLAKKSFSGRFVFDGDCMLDADVSSD